MQRGSWSNIATVMVLIVVAVIEALQQALANAPSLTVHLPSWTVSPNWNFVPLILLIIAGLLWLIGHVPAVPSSRSSVNTTPPIRYELAVAPVTQSKSIELAGTQQLPISQKRILIDLTPRQLSDIFRDHTSFQAGKLIEPYIGKWLDISGTTNDIAKNAWGIWRGSIYEKDLKGPLHIFMQFNPKWADHLSVLSRGSEIRVHGRIQEVMENVVNLDECDLL
jgi:hypothetical protein